MQFPPTDFSLYNESDVREEFVGPLLRHLGYRTGTEHDILRELTLTYDRISLGRRKNTDPLLRGRADYICIAGKRVRWVIEAKPPEDRLDLLSQEQAWTYANHPQVRAVYFCITNGRQFLVFMTVNGPDRPAIFSCTYEEMQAELPVVESILSPANLLRDHPDQVPDYGLPIGPGLRSIVRVTGGSVAVEQTSLHLPALEGYTVRVVSGSVERIDGVLLASLSLQAPFQKLQRLNEQLGLHNLVLECVDGDSVSCDPLNPTTFESRKQVLFPKGAPMLNIQTWEEILCPFDLPVQLHTLARGHLAANRFIGEFEGLMHMHMPLRTPFTAVQRGTVELILN